MSKQVWTFSMMLMLVLAVCAFAATSASAEMSAGGLATACGNVYALQGGELVLYDADAGGFRSLGKAISSEWKLVDSTDGFYLFSAQQQLLVELDTADPYAEINRWQLASAPSQQSVEVYRVAVAEDVLYLLISDFASDSFRGVWAYDLRTNQQANCPVPSAIDMTCAWDGSLVVYSAPFAKTGALYTWRIHEDAAQLQTAPGNYGQTTGGLACAEASQTVYFQAEGVVQCFDGHALQECAYTFDAIEGEWMAAAVTEDGNYLTYFSDGTLKELPVSGQERTTLRIAGRFSDPALPAAYCEANPDVAVVYTEDDPYDETDFAQAIINRTLHADIILTSTSSSLYQRLIQKGYVLALDENSELTAYIDSMYPSVAEQLTWDGRYFGVPVALSAQTMGYDPQLFAELSLDVPTTVEELLQFCLDTSLPADIGMLNDSLFTLSDVLLQQIMDIALSQGLDADMTAVQHLLNLWEQLENAGVGQDGASAEQALFVPVCEAEPGGERMGQEQYKPLLLAAAAGQSPAVPASMEVMLIYAGTTQAERCLDFIAYCARNADEATQIALLPDRNDPVVKEGLEEQIEEWENALSQTNDALAQQPDNETLLLQQEEAALFLQSLQNDPWQISPEDIASYREVAPYLVFSQRQWQYDTDDVQLYQLRERLRTHQLDADAFLQKYQELRWMMSQENGLQ